MIDHSSFTFEVNAMEAMLQKILASKKIYEDHGRTSECDIDGIDSLNREIESLKQKKSSLGKRIVENQSILYINHRTTQRLQQYYTALLKDHELNSTNLQIEHEKNSKLEEAVEEFTSHIAHMENKFEADKRLALENCQRTLEEEFKPTLDKLKLELNSIRSKLYFKKYVYTTTCDEMSLLEIRLKNNYMRELEERIGKVTDKIEMEKREWECFMRSQMEKEQTELENSVRHETELKEESQRNMDMMVSQASQACLEEQELVEQAEIEKALAAAKKQWQKKHKKDIKRLRQDKKLYESHVTRKKSDLLRCQQKLHMLVNKKKTSTSVDNLDL